MDFKAIGDIILIIGGIVAGVGIVLFLLRPLNMWYFGTREIFEELEELKERIPPVSSEKRAEMILDNIEEE